MLSNIYSSFVSRFYRLATVSVLSNMMVPLAGLCDTAFLGHLKDIRHLAGVILASILFDYLYRVLKFLRNSTNAMTAQAEGKEDKEGIILAGLRSGFIALAIALIIICLQYPIQKFGFAILSGSADIEASGIDYFYARIYGAPAVLLNFVLIGWFLGREKNTVVLLISLVANGSNVLLDYLMISRWGWASFGAGLATAVSQYLALFVGIVAVCLTVKWQDFYSAFKNAFDREALSSALALKGNILIRYLALISAYSIFTNVSATISTELLAENGLLLQIAFLSQFSVNGIGTTTQTLIGNFKGKGEIANMMPLMSLSMVNSVILALPFALSCILFPNTVFSILTNHSEINQGVTNYTIWLLPLLICTAIVFILEGYFIGLKKGDVLRNGSLVAFFLIFLPIIMSAGYLHNIDLLWISLIGYMTSLIIFLGSNMFKTQHILKEEVEITLNV